LHIHGGKLGKDEREIIKAAAPSVCLDASHFNEDG
jgi:hypothetical protein